MIFPIFQREFPSKCQSSRTICYLALNLQDHQLIYNNEIIMTEIPKVRVPDKNSRSKKLMSCAFFHKYSDCVILYVHVGVMF